MQMNIECAYHTCESIIHVINSRLFFIQGLQIHSIMIKLHGQMWFCKIRDDTMYTDLCLWSKVIPSTRQIHSLKLIISLSEGLTVFLLIPITLLLPKCRYIAHLLYVGKAAHPMQHITIS